LREKSVENYYMNLRGFAYEPIVRNGSTYIRVANLYDWNMKSLYIVNEKSLKVVLVCTTMPSSMIAEYEGRLLRNIDLILGGLK